MIGFESMYRSEGGRILIEMGLQTLPQLFNTLDPSPFHEKDLDADAEEYMVDAVRDIPPDDPAALVIYLPPAEAARERGGVLAEAIHNYFAHREWAARRHLRMVFRQGRFSLLVGLLFLAVCLGIDSAIAPLAARHFAFDFLKEGLLIAGWVAMWGPIQIFLYDWWPIRQTIGVYRRLSRIEVEIRSTAPPARAPAG